MGATIISVSGLGKRYRLGQATRHDTLRDQLVHAAKSFTGGARKEDAESASQILWALKDVSFEIGQGEVIGVIGRNGAGKSTLLKLLSQITEPTEGEIRLRGRLASLLEVGTGFHQELTGRENIFLNGAILGMRRSEIRKKFDEIVAFAEVEKFLDTPVKRYSSGMYVRLAFAVAAHLEPEILVVDEVLAVGDAAFQNKCLGKMEEVSQAKGRTVIFVSHNMSAVQALCGRAILLSQGRIKGIGGVDEQVRAYLEDVKSSGKATDASIRLGASLELRRLEFSPNPAASHGPVRFGLEVVALARTTLSDLHLLVHSVYGARVTIIDLRRSGGQNYALAAGEVLNVEGTIDTLPLVEGDYRIGLFVNCSQYHADFTDLTTLSVLGRPNASGNVPYQVVHRGILDLNFRFDSNVGRPS